MFCYNTNHVSMRASVRSPREKNERGDDVSLLVPIMGFFGHVCQISIEPTAILIWLKSRGGNLTRLALASITTYNKYYICHYDYCIHIYIMSIHLQSNSLTGLMKGPILPLFKHLKKKEASQTASPKNELRAIHYTSSNFGANTQQLLYTPT